MLLRRNDLFLLLLVTACLFDVLSNAASTANAPVAVTKSTERSETTNSTISDNSVATPNLTTISTALSNLVLSTRETVYQDQCPNEPVNLTEVTYSYGSANLFYSIAQQICRKIQAELTDQYLDELANITLLRGRSDEVKTILSYFLKEQTWAVVFLIIGALFIVLLPVSGICFFCGRCCNSCGAKRKHAHRSKCLLFIYLVLLIIVLAIIIACMALYSESIAYTLSNMDSINKSIDIVSDGIRDVTNTALIETTCKLDFTLSSLFSSIKEMIWKLPPNVYGTFENSFGFTVMQSIIDNLGNASDTFAETIASIRTTTDEAKAASVVPFYEEQMKNLTAMLENLLAQSEQVQEEFSEVYQQVNKTWNNVNSTILNSYNLVNQSLENANSIIDEAYNQTKKIIVTLNNSVGDIDSVIQNVTKDVNYIHEEIVTFPGYQAVSVVLYAVVLIPALLVLLPAILVVFSGTMRLPARDKYPSKRPTICSCAGYFGLFAVGAAFFTGWIVMLVASLSFLGGYSIETICRPLFYDPKMRLLKEVPFLKFDMTSPIDGKSFSINVGDVMEQCRDNQTILSALQFGTLIDVEAIMNKTNITGVKDEAVRAFKDIDLAYDFPEDGFDQLTSSFSQLEQLDDQLQNTTIPADVSLVAPKLKDDYEYMKNNISNLVIVINTMVDNVREVIIDSQKSNNFTDEGIQIFENLFKQTIDNVTAYIYDAKDDLLTNSFPCRPMYDIWETAGTILCQQFGRPVQGIWAAAGLMALCFIPAIVFIALIVKYLLRMKRQYDPKKHQRISGQHGGSGGIYAYDNSPQSSTFTLVSTGSSRSGSIRPWCSLCRRKPINPVLDEPEHCSIFAYDSPKSTARVPISADTPPPLQLISSSNSSRTNYWYSINGDLSPSAVPLSPSSITYYSIDRYPNNSLCRNNSRRFY